MAFGLRSPLCPIMPRDTAPSPGAVMDMYRQLQDTDGPTMQTTDDDMEIRQATREEVEAIVRLLEADTDSSNGHAWTPDRAPAYYASFDAIRASRDNDLYVACQDNRIVGTFQLSLMPGLTAHGGLRAKVEGVQVAADRRSSGIGARMMLWAMQTARERGAGHLELISNKRRTKAHRFYERLGFSRSHEGFKISL